MPTEPIEIPNAATHPAEYKQALLDLIGASDPLAEMEQTTPRIHHLCADLSDQELQTRPSSDEWSAKEVVAHLFDLDIVYGFRWRMVLTEDNPVYPGYAEDRWTSLPRLPFWPMFYSWQGLRAANVMLIRQTPPESWSRLGFPGGQDSESLDEMVRLVAGHDIAHVNQIARALEAVTGVASSQSAASGH
jgi:DinB superfamily